MSRVMSSELRALVAAAEIVDAGAWLTPEAENMLSQVELSMLKAFKHLADVIVVFAVTFPSGAINHLPSFSRPLPPQKRQQKHQQQQQEQQIDSMNEVSSPGTNTTELFVRKFNDTHSAISPILLTSIWTSQKFWEQWGHFR